MSVRRKKVIPAFENEEQEREFWAAHDSADYIDWQRAKDMRLPDLQPTTRTISIRLPQPMIERLKVLANKRDVPYQSLLKMYVAEKIREELRAME
jgi:predicted DNA binding CopG/RHH family protein